MSANKTSPTVKKAKLHSIMEAASALTALNDEETKRYIPEHKKPDAALTFPEKVSILLQSEVSERHARGTNACGEQIHEATKRIPSYAGWNSASEVGDSCVPGTLSTDLNQSWISPLSATDT